ncbi:MAG TPA: TetR family transcriptional regulator [Polyangiaceae bacterium]|nr:TetR family transcriptional regulator [Polyangiaceae bacterium]
MRLNPEKKEDRERVAQELLRVTLRLAAAHGFVSLGLREVSRAADIAPTSFYRHFADMEELGRELIESLAGPFIADWIASARANRPQTGNFALAVANRATASAVEDPDLMRFILAERVGAIPAFRAALAAKLSSISAAVADSVTAETSAPARPDLPAVAHAIVVLILGACGDLLDGGAAHAPLISERLAAQIRLLLPGAARSKGGK